MRPVLLLAVGCSLLALGACESRDAYRAKREAKESLKTISKLECPETQGALKRVSAAPDGKSCLYSSGEAEVELRLVNLIDGDADATLEPIEAELRGLMPEPSGTEIAAAEAEADAEVDAADAKAAAADAKADAAEAKADAADAKGSTGRETVRLPGLTVTTEQTEKGEKANVRMPGLTVNSEGDSSTVTMPGMRIESNDGTDEVRISRDRWSREEDDAWKFEDGDVHIDGGPGLIFGPKTRGIRTTFIKTSDAKDSPFAAVGYEARGPKKGPLAVAVVKVKGPRKNNGSDTRLLKDALALVKLNVGG